MSQQSNNRGGGVITTTAVTTVSCVSSVEASDAWTQSADCLLICAAPSKNVRCRKCQYRIENVRVGVIFNHKDGFVLMRWFHLDCCTLPLLPEKTIDLNTIEGLYDEEVEPYREQVDRWLTKNGLVVDSSEDAQQEDHIDDLQSLSHSCERLSSLSPPRKSFDDSNDTSRTSSLLSDSDNNLMSKQRLSLGSDTCVGMTTRDSGRLDFEGEMKRPENDNHVQETTSSNNTTEIKVAASGTASTSACVSSLSLLNTTMPIPSQMKVALPMTPSHSYTAKRACVVDSPATREFKEKHVNYTDDNNKTLNQLEDNQNNSDTEKNSTNTTSPVIKFKSTIF